MNSPQAPQPRHVRYRTRYQARLDAEASAKLQELTSTFRRKRGPILRYVLQWGLSHSKDWTIDQSIPASTKPVPVLLEPALLQQVQDAAAAHGASMAAWLRAALREVTHDDFPASWRAGETVITGSFNFTKAAQEQNAENLLIIRDQALAAQYREHWKAHAQHSQAYVGRGVR